MKIARCDIYQACPQSERKECFSWRYRCCEHYPIGDAYIEITDREADLLRKAGVLKNEPSKPLDHLTAQQFEQVRREM